MNSLDKAISELSPLQYRSIIRELVMLTRWYIRARAYKGLKRRALELKARWTLGTRSDGARAILEAALRSQS